MNEKKQPEFQIDSFEYNLSSPVGYAETGKGQSGHKLYTDKVTLVSPLVKFLIKSMRLSQFVNLAIMKAIPIFKTIRKYSDPEEIKLLEEGIKKEEEERKKEGKPQTPAEMGDGIRQQILTSDINFEKVIEVFQDLAQAGCVLVEKKSINFMQWDEISQPDQVEMFYQFAGVFIMPSLFPAPKEEQE